MKKYFKSIEPYLKPVKQATLASCKGKKPWSATVFFAYDEELNLYFLSQTHRRHSLEIIDNPNVSLGIAEQTFEMGDKVRGLQIEGKCIVLEGEEAKKAFTLVRKRFVKAKDFVNLKLLVKAVRIAISPNQTKIWRVTPTLIKVFDEKKYGSEGKKY